MKYKYPKLSNCLTFEKINAEQIRIIDYLTGKRYVISTETARFIKKLDGKTSPYQIKTTLSDKKINEIMVSLFENDLIRLNKIHKTSDALMKTIWIPKSARKLSVVAEIWNKLLLYLWIPVLIIGLFVFNNNWLSINYDCNILWGNILGLITGIVLHEFGHAMAAVSYKGKFFEMGVMLMYHILPAAYVFIDNSIVKKRMQRIQIFAAGIETNFLLSGLFLILASVFPQIGGNFFVAAINNMLLALINAMFINGLDGCAIMSELMSETDLIGKIKTVIKNKLVRKQMRKWGLSGHATIAVCYILAVFQISLISLVALNFLEVFLCFV